MKILSIGHATYELQFGGHVILTDPWFTTSGFTYQIFTRRVFPLKVDPASLERCDLMLVSHNHFDHLSKEAFTAANRLGSCVAGPRSVIRRARRAKISYVHELWPGEKFSFGEVAITAVPAVHPLAKDAVGFLIEGERTVYFSGDTRFDWSIVNRLRGKKIDVAILQVSCAFYSWLGGADGMDINYAEELAKALRPEYVIPMHYDCVGKYLDIPEKIRVNKHSLDVEEALERFETKLGRSGIKCAILYSGQALEL